MQGRFDGGGGSAGGGYHGGGGGSNMLGFDGKPRTRKPIVRKCIDPNSSFISYVNMRKFARDFRDLPAAYAMNPHSAYKRYILPPGAFKRDDLSSVVCTKFCRSSTNKQRCPVNCLMWTPEGRRLITGNSVGEFTLWNGLAFNFETILQAHDDAVRAMVWSHNDNWFVTADHGGVIKYWQSSMTNVQLVRGHREAVRSLSFSPTDYKFVSCSDDATVKIWDFESVKEERVLTGHGWDVKCVAYHPSKALLASGSKDNLIKIWDPKSGQSLHTLHGHKNTVVKVDWNQNGNWLLTASRDQLIKLYDIRTLKEFATMKGHAREVTSLAWHPVWERLFLSGSYDGSLFYWNVGQESPIATIPHGHDNAVWDIQWHPAGHVVASGSNDHSTKFWCRNRPGDCMDDKYNAGVGEERDMDGMIPGHHHHGGGGGGQGGPSSASMMMMGGGSFKPMHGGGHWIEDCPSKDEGGGMAMAKAPPAGYLCKRCNIAGHYISDCPQAKIPPATYVCHKCRQKGHWKQDCPLDGAPGGGGGGPPGGGFKRPGDDLLGGGYPKRHDNKW
ncbi:hypothetical protein DYB37_006163 [Aphanomyces astaci]|uniref:CCHC-type domain-containing protein n=2 Tax=Aphanomyces astaci TaxID=112090 RepID=A0A418ERA7_APHAT|nr:hypothetical protein DYB37_006163 [Aphanomyces astaci]